MMINESTPIYDAYRTTYVHAYNESAYRKAMRLSFCALGAIASYASLIPTVYTSKAFDPFPGAKEITMAAVILCFGSFGALNYYDLANILFDPSNGKMNIGKVIRVFFSCLLGIASRLPSAGIALKVAPGIPEEWRLFWAIFSVLGTCSPEIVSTDRSITLAIEALFKTNDVALEHKNELARTLRRQRRAFIQMSDEERMNFIGEMKIAVLQNNEQWFFQRFCSIHAKKCLNLRKFIHFNIGCVTSLGSVCALTQNVVLTNMALSFFVPEEAAWKWGVSVISALTLGHTIGKTSYVAAKQWFNTGIRCCTNEPSKRFTETFYPKTDFAISLFAAFWSIALFGIYYEAAESSVGLDNWKGNTMLTGNVIASFFLIYKVIQEIFERGIFYYASSSCAPPEVREVADCVTLLNNIENSIHNSSISREESSEEEEERGRSRKRREM